MKSHWWSLALVLLVTIAAASIVTGLAIQRQSRQTDAVPLEQRFQVRGEVRELDVAGKSIRIEHEEIPNYMAAMTMPFEVRDASWLRGLKAGDEVGFELVVTQEDSWIASIYKLSEVSAAGAVADISQLAAKEMERVQVGETVPDFALTDQ